MKNLAIIPARGGSKRIPRKNVKEFLGKPIIAYSIETALKSGLFDEVMVSTDDEEIAAIARQYGAKVPFMRSPENSNDFAGDGAVLHEVLNEYKNRGYEFDYMVYLYPCAPFVTAERLREAIQLLVDTKATVISPVTRYSTPIQKALWIQNEELVHAFPECASMRSQEMEPAYYPIGSFFAIDAREHLAPTRPGKRLPLVVPEREVVDIDTFDDWELAEVKYRYYVLGQK